MPLSRVRSSSVVRPTLIGGFTAGTLDGLSAFYSFGFDMPRGIASGVLGANAFVASGGGAGAWVLGLVLHYAIALSAAAVYVGASRRLGFLKKHFLVCGVFHGIAVYLVMNLIVLPLSAVPFAVGPFSVQELRIGLLVHILLIGLPISASLRFASTERAGAAA